MLPFGTTDNSTLTQGLRLLQMTGGMSFACFSLLLCPFGTFVTEVAKLCPKGNPIPSEKWVDLQFWPKNSTKLSCFTILDASD